MSSARHLNFFHYPCPRLIVNFIVSPLYRKQGVGEFLLSEIENYAKEKGYCKVNLEVRNDNIKAQNVYKTPSGKKYHLASCRMVENVSSKLLGKEDISKHHLTPCKICKPPEVENLGISYVLVNKAVGKSVSVRCKGITKKGTRCKHFTKIANGFCYQHTNQDSK